MFFFEAIIKTFKFRFKNLQFFNDKEILKYQYQEYINNLFIMISFSFELFHPLATTLYKCYTSGHNIQ